jgi:hypothetical protein
MGSILKIFILFCGLAFIGVVFYLLMKRKISERNSLFWLLGSIIIFILSAVPEALEIVARSVGVDYPPTLLFLLSILILLLIVLHQSIQISVLNDQLRELTQRVVLNEKTMDNDRNGEEKIAS